MEKKSLLSTTPHARLISTYPNQQDLHFSLETINPHYKIYQNENSEIFIRNFSALHLSIDSKELEINQERKLFGCEKVSFNQDDDQAYIFHKESFQTDEIHHKLGKIENDFQKELTCSICTNLLHKCMTLIPCQHSLCSFCLFEHLKSSNKCPLCRVEAISITKNSILSNLVQLAVNHFPSLLKSQMKNDFEQIDLEGVIVRNKEGVYVGSYINNTRDGQGKMVYYNGEVYEGNWKNNRADGKGTMIFKSGNRYDGFWVNDRRHGFGKSI